MVKCLDYMVHTVQLPIQWFSFLNYPLKIHYYAVTIHLFGLQMILQQVLSKHHLFWHNIFMN